MLEGVKGQPLFTHDCDNCKFLGRYDGHDLYVCPSRERPSRMWSVLARYGNDGPEYASGHVEMYGQLRMGHRASNAIRVAQMIVRDMLPLDQNCCERLANFLSHITTGDPNHPHEPWRRGSSIYIGVDDVPALELRYCPYCGATRYE